MTNKRELTSDSIKCLHCKNTSRFLILGTVDNFEEETTYDDYPVPEQGDVYQILACENCKKDTIRKYFWVEGWEDDEDRSVEFEYLYPNMEKKKHYSLPLEVKKGLESAEAVKSIDANAYGVLLRRLLELVCIDQQAIGTNLHGKLKDLAARNIIPDTLASMAHGLRNLGNVGAHAGSGDLTSNETELMSTLCEAIIEYVYYAPSLLAQATTSLNKIKQAKQP